MIFIKIDCRSIFLFNILVLALELQYIVARVNFNLFQALKDERLKRLWSHPVVLNLEPLDWESSTLITSLMLSKRNYSQDRITI